MQSWDHKYSAFSTFFIAIRQNVFLMDFICPKLNSLFSLHVLDDGDLIDVRGKRQRIKCQKKKWNFMELDGFCYVREYWKKKSLSSH